MTKPNSGQRLPLTSNEDAAKIANALKPVNPDLADRQQLITEIQRLRQQCLRLANEVDEKNSPYTRRISEWYEPEIERLGKMVEKLEAKTTNKIQVPIPRSFIKFYNTLHAFMVRLGSIKQK
jgi:hypothetical protein